MKLYRVAFAAMSLALAVGFANAQCAKYYNVVPDGRISSSYYSVAASSANANFFSLTAGRSYSVEVSMPFDAYSIQPLQVFVNEIPGGTCILSNSGVTVNNATAVDPNPGTGSSNVTRLTFTALISTDFGYVVVNNTDASNTHYYNVTVSETTMFSPSWSTFTPFLTQWGLQNTTGSTINAVLTVTDTFGGGPYKKTVAIAPSATVFVRTGDSFVGGPIPANHGGGAILTHDGPPGAIVANCYILNTSGTVIFPVEFRGVRENNH